MLSKDIATVENKVSCKCEDCMAVVESWQRIKTVLVEAQKTPTNKPMPKLPTLEEVQKEVQSRVWGGGFVGISSNITEIVYNFICRQLSA